ncbi:MAG TPA: DNA/RNA non-specific endonuclease [Tepidisphaeraceae bacterium]|jgi:endonuclease G|nr:DNA/RNA non-specific endonuclease [Tepidisphaeraceae bacterium]
MPRKYSNRISERDVEQAYAAYQGLAPGQRKIVTLILIAAAIFALVAFLRQKFPAGGGAVADSDEMLLGNPSGATPDPLNTDNYLMVKPYFAVGYDAALGEPRWVSWEVTPVDLGDAPRKQIFDPDQTLPMNFTRVTTHDYSDSGFDRGHMCPHGDRTANLDMSYATFIMTNVIPQAPNVNRKAWAQLEEYCRELAKNDGDHLYIMDGPAGEGGRGSMGFRDTVGHGRVVVPAYCWKVAVVVPPSSDGNDLAHITPASRVIAVWMPNDQEKVGEEWDSFRTTPAVIEAKTGLHFFSKLAPAVASGLDHELDKTYIPPPEPMKFDD